MSANILKTKPAGHFSILIFCLAAWGCEQDPKMPPTPVYPDAAMPAPPPPPPDSGPSIPDGGFVRPDTGVALIDAGQGPQACNPPLAITPTNSSATPLALVNFRGIGGTGAYKYELSSNNSGAVLNSESGAYLSGTAEQVTDTIIMTDLGCIGTATATVDVLSNIVVKPLNAVIPNDGSVLFEVTEGSGQYRFEVLRRPEGTTAGTISPVGFYQAPNADGQDIIRIEDEATGYSVDAYIRIEAGAQLQAVPEALYMPVGSESQIRVFGGSGYFDVASNTPNFLVNNGVLTASVAGESTLAITDRYTAQSTQVKAYALLSQTMTTTRSGSYINSGAVVRTGDINQDGFLDVAVAWAETNYSADDSGAVFIYQGIAGGLDPNPVRILSEGGRSAQFGRDMTIGDLDGDGLLDLVVGAIRADLGLRDNGGVYIYSGTPNSFFSPQPTRTIGGVNAYDLSGFSVEVCDFNADGKLDLAIGAAYAEDRLRRTRSNDQGAIYIHMGRTEGFLDTPDVALYGDLPQGDGTFAGRTSLQLGRSLVAGDFNGDGACDLAAGSYVYDAGPTNTDDGMVFIYKGRAQNGTSNGGLIPFPVRGYAATVEPERAANFARFMAAGDLDGDQADELIVTQFRAENAAAGGINRGAVRIYQELDLPDTAMLNFRAVETATLTWFGEDDYDEAGWYVRVGDVDGDLIGDLIIGNHSDEVPGGPNNAGTIVAFAGRSGFLPDVTTSTPALLVGGTNSSDRLGVFFDVVGDIDQDGINDLVALSAYSKAYGVNLGAPFFVPGDRTKPLELLDMPGFSGGDHFGWALDFVGDVNGDTYNDLVVGAQRLDPPNYGINAGGAALYLGGPAGFGTQPDMEFVGYRRHSGGDHSGSGITRAGDFNGDSIPDFAILARYDDQPGSFGNNYEIIGDCGGSKNNSGAIFIFLGSNNGLPSDVPAFIYYGPHGGSEIYKAIGGLNVDNDGYDDLVVAGLSWDQPGANNVGGFTIIKGRPESTNGRTQIICDVSPTMYGWEANGQLGYGLGRVGDLDGDNCDEFAIGARSEDNGSTNQGIVRIIFGAGPNCANNDYQLLTLESRARFSRAGTSLAGGFDVDGDSIPDLVVGGNEFRANNTVVGGAWLIRGAYLNSLTPEPLSNAVNATFYGFSDPSNQLNLTLRGTTGSGGFGRGVALVPGLSGPNQAGVAVGVPLGDFNGTSLSGEVHIYKFDAQIGLLSEPSVSFFGETKQTSGRPGTTLVNGEINGRQFLGVGAYDSAGQQNFAGASYLLEIQP